MKKKIPRNRSLPYCKTCSHDVDYHAVGKFSKVVSYFITDIYSRCMVGPWCKCRQFIPKDNLKYLEWAYVDNQRI